MPRPDHLRAIETSEVDYPTLINALRGYHFPRNKIGSLLKSGQLIRVKKGLYVKGDSAYSLPVLANMIYGPSYVSQEYALALHAMIPERVHTVTSMALGRKRRFETPVGTFTYEPLSERFFPLGVQRLEVTFTQGFLVATPEKALIDLVWKRSDLGTPGALESFLVDDMRVDLDQPNLFSRTRVRELEKAYNRPVVTALAAVISARLSS